MIVLICITILALIVAVGIGYVGYLAFGDEVKSVILYNLPNEDPLSVIAKICYILTIIGSFVIVANPVFTVIEKANWYKSLAGLDDDKTPLKRQGSSAPAMNLEKKDSNLPPDE